MKKAIIMLSSVLWAACGLSEADELREKLLLDSGGYDTKDEAVMFGNQQSYHAIGEAEEDPEATDEMADAEEVVDLETVAQPQGNIYYLALAAGYLQHGRQPVDISGSLSVSRGALVVLRTIKHDPGDEILERTDPKLIEWVASTAFVDGMLVKVIDDASVDVPLTITLQVGDITRTLDSDELSGMAHMKKLPSGFKLATAASIVDLDAQAGFCGLKFRSAAQDVGTFRGKWVGQRGHLSGHIDGLWGVKEGEQVFYGKYISANGAFEGLLEGTYNDDNGFDGIIRDANEQVIGALEGRYSNDGFGVCRWTLN